MATPIEIPALLLLLRPSGIYRETHVDRERESAGTAAIQANAAEHKANVQARQLIMLLAEQGLTLAAIAEKLNVSSYRTRRGCMFRAKTIFRLKASV